MKQRLAGITLLEVLAAIVLLGLVVATVTPVLLRLSTTSDRLERRLIAEAILDEGVSRPPGPPPAGSPAPPHPGWSVRVAYGMRIGAPGDARTIPHRWARLSAIDPAGQVVAERMLPVPDVPPPPTPKSP